MSAVLDWLADPWTSGIMRRALAEVTLAGGLCGGLGCFVVVRGLAFLSESMAHTMLLGVVLAFALGVPTLAGAAVIAGLTVLLAVAVGSDRRVTFDTAMGVLLPTLFGAAVAVAALVEGYRSRLADALFGSVLGVTGTDLVIAASVAAVVLAILVVAGRRLELVACDRALAEAMGLRVRLLDLLLLAAVTLAVVVALRAVGNVLVTALVLGPALTARLLARRFWPMVAWAAGIAVACGVIGLYATWYADVGAGAAITLAVAAAFLVAALGARVARPRWPLRPRPAAASLAQE
jgi:manganese/iron transport system permease protein